VLFSILHSSQLNSPYDYVQSFDTVCCLEKYIAADQLTSAKVFVSQDFVRAAERLKAGANANA